MRKKVYAAYLADLEKSKMELEQVRKDDQKNLVKKKMHIKML